VRYKEGKWRRGRGEQQMETENKAESVEKVEEMVVV